MTTANNEINTLSIRPIQDTKRVSPKTMSVKVDFLHTHIFHMYDLKRIM